MHVFSESQQGNLKGQTPGKTLPPVSNLHAKLSSYWLLTTQPLEWYQSSHPTFGKKVDMLISQNIYSCKDSQR